ncbi:hypothetical protein [Kocuria sp. NPDC057446]|uniref:hypothetical protein n=1 Tax=Kocuria sp. NPDC057446 TaxID=3346137 RepID=UPI00369DBCF6
MFPGEQSERGQWPAAIDTSDRGWDTDSSRLLATHDGVGCYAVAGKEGDGLITFDPASTEDRVAGCSPGGCVGTSGQVGVTTDFVSVPLEV